jgi:hypothetical protein
MRMAALQDNTVEVIEVEKLSDCVDDFAFIKAYKAHQCLYNVKLAEYRNVKIKSRAYLDIAEKFKMSVGKYSLKTFNF